MVRTTPNHRCCVWPHLFLSLPILNACVVKMTTSTTTASPKGDGGAEVTVVYVQKRWAKHVKTALQDQGSIHTDFRMTPATDSIAIPIQQGCDATDIVHTMKEQGVLGYGRMYCPYSTAVWANHTGRRRPRSLAGDNDNTTTSLTLVEQALLNAIWEHNKQKKMTLDNIDSSVSSCGSILQQIRTSLGPTVCPKKVELLGDDRTIVLARHAFSLQGHDAAAFAQFLQQHVLDCPTTVAQETFLVEFLWPALATVHNHSPRVVRRADIAASSAFRQSNVQLLWPTSDVPGDTTGNFVYNRKDLSKLFALSCQQVLTQKKQCCHP